MLRLIDEAARTLAATEVRSAHHISLARTTGTVSMAPGAGPAGSPALMPTAVLPTVSFGGTHPLAITPTS